MSALLLLACKKDKKNDSFSGTPEPACDGALVFDSIYNYSNSDTLHIQYDYYIYIYGKNFFCKQKSLELLLKLQNSCGGDTLVKRVITPDSGNYKSNYIYFKTPVEPYGKGGKSRMFIKLIAGTDTLELNPASNPSSRKIVYFVPNFFLSNVFQYVRAGDQISMSIDRGYLGSIGSVTVNNVSCAFQSILEDPRSSDFDLTFNIPSGLTLGKLDVKVTSKCGEVLTQYPYQNQTVNNLHLTTTQFRFIPQVLKYESSPNEYVLSISVSDVNQYSGSYQFKLKNKITNEVINLPAPTGYGYVSNYREYTYRLSKSTYSGVYTVIVNNGTTHTCPTSSDVNFD
jgi:hypothetical protein